MSGLAGFTLIELVVVVTLMSILSLTLIIGAGSDGLFGRDRASDAGQAGVLVAFALMAGCWAWAGHLLRMPDEQRVFVGVDERQVGR